MAGALPIPVSEIEAYCNLFYLRTLPERERLFFFITELDMFFLERMQAKAEANSPKKPS